MRVSLATLWLRPHEMPAQWPNGVVPQLSRGPIPGWENGASLVALMEDTWASLTPWPVSRALVDAVPRGDHWHA